MKCQHCRQGTLREASLTQHWAGFAQIPADCEKCGKINWISNEVIGVNPLTEYQAKIPELEEDTIIYVTNRDHPRWLQPAIIIKRDHVHYRILFPDKVRLWVPESWVREIPAQKI